MGVMIEQRSQLLQIFGSIATSAASAAAEGIAEAVKTDSKTADAALKLFGGFDRSEFEKITSPAPGLLVPAVRPPASYEGPTEYLKTLSNAEGSLVPAKDLLRQLEDAQFRMSDGLAGFSDHRITSSLAENGFVITGEDGISAMDGKPADLEGMTDSIESFNKLYSMENTVAKQLELHQQLDFGAGGRLLGSRVAPLPKPENPKLNQPLKEMPDVSTTLARDEMVNLLKHALTGTPKTTGELLMMVDTLQAKLEDIINSIPPDAPNRVAIQNFCRQLLAALSNVEDSAKNRNPNLPPDYSSVHQLRMIQMMYQNAGAFLS